MKVRATDNGTQSSQGSTGVIENAGVAPQVEAETRRRRLVREAALQEGPTRESLYTSHPLVCNTVRVITKPLQEAYEVIAQVIVHRDPGTCLIADFRIGKTRGIGVIKDELASTFPTLPVGVINAKHHETASERTFFGDILEDYRHGAAQSGTAADRRRRLLSLWEAAARSTGSDRYVLFVDEGQNWGEAEYTWLRDATNDMQQRNVNVITIIFAHPELIATRGKMLARRRTDLIGRFLLTPRAFRGLRDLEELRHTLKAYDGPALHEFPQGSGISMSEFFLPKAFANGWCLEHEATAMWSAFVTIAGRTGHNAENIGMQWVASAIRIFLFSSFNADGPMFCGDEKAWLYAVEASGYESSLG